MNLKLDKSTWIRSSIGVLVSIYVSASLARTADNSEFRIGISQEFETLNPNILSMSASYYLSYFANRPWYRMTAEGQWVADLAQRIPTKENGLVKFEGKGKDLKITATYEIANNAKWGDGKPVICDDLKFAWEVGLVDSVAIPNREPWKDIKSITWTKEKPTVCEVKYNNAKWSFFQDLFRPLPRHVEGPILTKYKNKKMGYDQNSEYNRNPTNPGLYNGPYLITELKLGSHLVFTANPGYYGNQPKIKKIIFKYIPNTATLEANLRSGNIDAISQLGVTFDQAVAFDKKVKAENLPYVVHFKPGLTYEHIDLNLDNPILKDINVRKALVLSVNREELVKFLFEGKQQAAIHNLTPLDPGYTNDPKIITLYSYNRQEATKLLDKAGWVVGKDGIRTKDRKRLSLVIMTTAGNKTRETVETYLQEQWKKIGVDVTIKNEPARTFFGETTAKRKFESLAMYAWQSVPEQSPMSTLHSKNIPSDKNGWAGQNYPGYKSAKVDELIEKFELEFDKSKRVTIMHDILKNYSEDVPVIPLYYRAEVAVTPKNMKEFKLTGHLYYDSLEAEKWDLGNGKIN